MKVADLRKEVDVRLLGSGNVSLSWEKTVIPFHRLFVDDDFNKIGFIVSDKGDARVVSLVEFSLEVFNRVDKKEVMLDFWTKDGRQMSVVAEVKEKEEVVESDKTGLQLETLLAEDIIANVFKGQKIVPSVEWFEENCIRNEKFGEFVGKWLSKNDPKSLLRFLHSDAFKANTQIGALSLVWYLNLAALDADLCESILRRVLDKPREDGSY